MSELDPLLQVIFDAERARPDPPAAARARVMSRVAATVGLLPPGGGGRHGGGGHGSLAPVASASAPLLARPVAWLASAFIAGGLVGAGVHASIARSERRVVEVAGPAEQPVLPVPTVAPAQAARAPVESASVTAPARAPVASTRARSPAHDADLAQERALLEVARTALARGQDEAALRSLDEHATRFPNGRLTEEREVLTVQALASSGRVAEARDRAARFRSAFPQSILLPAVDAALVPIP